MTDDQSEDQEIFLCDDADCDDPYNPHTEHEWENPLAPDDEDHDSVPDDEEDDQHD